MNRAVIYTEPGAWFATPVASTGPPLAVLTQPVYGEAGYDPTIKPTFSPTAGPYDVTFEPDVLALPAGATLYATVRSVVVALRAPLDLEPFELASVTHLGGTAQYRAYGQPRDPTERDALRIKTVVLHAFFSTTYPGGTNVVTITPAAGVQVGPMRGTYRAHT